MTAAQATGRHAYPYTGAARIIDELHKPTPTTAAPHPPRRSPAGVDRGRVGAEVSPTPQQEQLPGDTSTTSTPTADLMQPTGEGVAPHSLIRRATPASLADDVDTYDDSIDVDEVPLWAAFLPARRSAVAHVNASRSR